MKKLFLGFLLAVLCLALVACNFTTNNNEGGGDNGGGGGGGNDNPPSGQITHLQNFVRDMAETAQLRNYNEMFDTLIEDFSTVGSQTVGSHLRVVVDNEIPAAPMSADAAIYKMATGAYEIQNYDGIGFRIRKVGEGALELSNLVLALRGDDAYKVYEINFADAVDPDGEALNALTGEYQDFIICPNLSIEDDSTEYELAAGGASGVKVLDKILGFHLYLKGECAQIIEIEQVFIMKGAEKTVLDSFDREKVNKADATCWWRDSTGFIVQRGAMLAGGAKYNFNLPEDAAANLVLNIMGDTSEAKVGGVAWANLKDAEGNAIPAAVNGAFFPIVINLEKSGITGKAIEIESGKEIVISKIYLTNLMDKAPVTEYPYIDTVNHVAMFDNFNRTQSGFDGDYDKSATNPVVTGAGLNYALSYHNGEFVSIEDGVVTFDAQGLDGADYINFKEGRTVYDGQKYLVLVVKAENGATFDNFRFDVGNGVTYINQMYSAFGLKLPAADATNYPYTDSQGFMWLVIDLKESGMAPNASDGFIDFYYSGAGMLHIDSAFYCDAEGDNIDYQEIKAGNLQHITDLTNYGYVGGINMAGDKILKVVFNTEDEVANLNSFRFQNAETNAELWFKDGKVIDVKGQVISGDTKLKGLTLMIDCEKSGFAADLNHLHAGGFGDAGVCDCTIEVYRLHADPFKDYAEIETGAINAITDLTTYQYLNGFSCEGDKYIKMVFTTDNEDVTLFSIRFENPETGAQYWFKDNKVIGADGAPISGDTKLKGLTIIVDAEATGLSKGWNHLHGGGMGDAGEAAITVKAYRLHQDMFADYAEIETGAINAITDLSGYNYLNGFSCEGDRYIKLVFTTDDENVTLYSFRFENPENGAQSWFKDGKVIGADGAAIGGDTKLKDLTIIIDGQATGLSKGWNHLHAGDMGDAGAVAITAKAYRLHDVKYAKLMIDAVR